MLTRIVTAEQGTTAYFKHKTRRHVPCLALVTAALLCTTALHAQEPEQSGVVLKLSPTLGSAKTRVTAPRGLDKSRQELAPAHGASISPVALSPDTLNLAIDRKPTSEMLVVHEPPAPALPPAIEVPLWANIMMGVFIAIVAMIFSYTLRHYAFSLSRLFGRQSQMYLDIVHANWPNITVLIAAHNEERVIADSLAALLEVDYPIDRMKIIPVNDRSIDKTKAIIDDFASRYPNRILPFHREGGTPGKSAALKDAMAKLTDDIMIIFDADYLPGRGLIKQLVAPFFDPEVGASMGRVVPMNPQVNLLTGLLDLERTGGYQVDQQARANLNLTTQYGGTVGGIRRTALDQVGGWTDDRLAEDTDITFRLRTAGWKVVYQNRSECYEEVPEEWAVRIKQIRRWAKGHHQVLISQMGALLKAPQLRFLQKVDGAMLLLIFCMSPLILLGWLLAMILFYAGHGIWASTGLVLMAFTLFAGMGNFAAFFEIASAAFLDGRRSRAVLLPLGLINFIVSSIEISRATASQTLASIRGKGVKWDKTKRYRSVRRAA